MGKMKEYMMDLEEQNAREDQAMLEMDAIEEVADPSTAALRQAAQDLHGICLLLQMNAENFDATFLPVTDAVKHIMASLQNDAGFLEKLADVCADQKKVA